MNPANLQPLMLVQQALTWGHLLLLVSATAVCLAYCRALPWAWVLMAGFLLMLIGAGGQHMIVVSASLGMRAAVPGAMVALQAVLAACSGVSVFGLLVVVAGLSLTFSDVLRRLRAAGHTY